MADIANFLAQNSPRFNRAEQDRSHFTNALMRNDVQRLPQQNRVQDLAIQSAEMDIGDAQQKGASDFLARSFALMAQEPQRAQEILASPGFQSASKALQLPPFSVDGETLETIAQKSTGWGQVFSGQGQQQQRVQSTFVGRNGNQWIVTSDGRTQDTGVPVSQFAQRPVETGAGVESFDPASGRTAGPISPDATAPALDAAAEARKYAENLGAGRGQNAADFEAGAPQRTERARQQITVIDNVLSAVDEATSKIDWSTTGFVGSMARNVAGTPAHDLQQQLLTIQANLGFDRIQQMRESSPTGGALGQVAVQELNALQASVAAIAQSQSDQQLRDNLAKVKTHYQNWRNVITQSQDRANGMPDLSQMSDADLLRIINGQ